MAVQRLAFRLKCAIAACGSRIFLVRTLPLATYLGCLALSSFLCGPIAAQQSDNDILSDAGTYDTINVAGFLLPISDVEKLTKQNVLRFNRDTERLGFGKRITSERSLSQAISKVKLSEPKAIRDLYRVAKVPLPNAAAHTLTIPSGFGPARLVNQTGGPALSVGFGGVSRVPYTDEPDGGIAFGLSFGNSFDGIGGSLGFSLNDLSDIGNSKRVSFGFEFSKYITDGLSIAVGGENLFVQKTDGQASYYIVSSWAFDADKGFLPFDGVLSLGLGSGRFAEKTPRDIAEGKGKNGTILFGALAVEVRDNVNLIADWNGRNLGVGAAFRIPRTGVSVKIGVRDLTNNSGDGPRITGSMGFTLAWF